MSGQQQKNPRKHDSKATSFGQAQPDLAYEQV